jgi:uncharacterized protein
MQILFSINHPAQYHMFRYLAKKLVADGNDAIFFIQSRGIIEQLLNSDNFEYKYSVSPQLRSWFKGKYGIIMRGIISLIQQEFRILSYTLFNRVDIMLGTDIAIAHTGFILRIPSMVFSDDDYVFTKPYCHLAFPFARHIVSPKSTDTHKWEVKKISYSGTQKTAYLHPKYFKPNKSVLKKYKLLNETFYMIRLVTYEALHDSLHEASTGISEKILGKLITKLEMHGKVIISLEDGNITRFKNNNIEIDPNDMHHLIYYADLFIGDSQSMHIEAGLLGTPSIRSNKWVIAKDRVNVIDYLENEWNIGTSVAPNDEDELLNKVGDLLNSNTKTKARELSQQFFAENTNLTDFLYWFLSNYPNSYHEYVLNNEIANEFH